MMSIVPTSFNGVELPPVERFLRLLDLRFFFWVRFPAISSVGAYSIPCFTP
jgi:hypothetical protein